MHIKPEKFTFHQEAERKIKRALRHKIRKQEAEEINVGEKIYYKKNKEDKWRGPARVLGKEGKTVLVKQGSDIRETIRSHVIKVRKMGYYFENNENNENKNKGENDEDEGEMEW